MDSPYNRVVGRYTIYDEIAAGGMATIHLGRLRSVGGFSRTVAIKRLHAHYARDPEFVAQFLDEARLAARVHHPNVVSTLDVVARSGELFLVMEYVKGESVSRLLRTVTEAGADVPLPIASAIGIGLLSGLHAVHEAKSEQGEPLHGVHRDVSPQNILVGADGVVRVLDLGIAKAANRLHSTRGGEVKGKFAYMAPEQFTHEPVDRRADIWAAAIVLWEVFSGRRLFAAETPAQSIALVIKGESPLLSTMREDVPTALDDVLSSGLSREPQDRFATAQEMAAALESAVAPATTRELGAWVRAIAADVLETRERLVTRIESTGPTRDDDEPVASHPSPEANESTLTAATPAAPADPAAPPTKAAAGGSRYRPLVASLVLVLLGVVVGTLLLARRYRSTVTPEPSATAAASPSLLPPPPLAASLSSLAPVQLAPPAVSAVVEPSRPTIAAPAHVRPPVRPGAKPAHSTTDCSQPFTFDSQGVKIPKVECL